MRPGCCLRSAADDDSTVLVDCEIWTRESAGRLLQVELLSVFIVDHFNISCSTEVQTEEGTVSSLESSSCLMEELRLMRSVRNRLHLPPLC